MTGLTRLGTVALLASALSVAAVASLRPAAGTDPSAVATESRPAQRERPIGAPRRSNGQGPLVPMVADTEVVAATELTTVRTLRVRGELIATYRHTGAAEPRSIQVIAVPAPTELGEGDLDVAVAPQGRVELLSARTGVVPAASGGVRTSTLVARVPTGAAAGALKVAEVEFANDTATATVTVELTVTRIRRTTLRPTRPMTAVYPGERLRVVLIAQNLGNAPDTLQLTAAERPGWKIDQIEPVILAPGEQREVTVSIRTPPPPASGTVPVRLRSMVGTREITSFTVPVELIPDPRTSRQLGGPTLVAGMASAVGDSTGEHPVIGLALDGPLSEEVALRGRLIFPTDRADFNQFAMSRVGYFRDASFLTASGKGWTATAGRTGFAFSPLFGWNASGLGASGGFSRGPWSVGVLASQERHAGMRGTGGNQFGVTVGRQMGRGRLTATATHLEQRVGFDRSLDAAGLTYAFTPRPGMTLTGEAGYRSSEAGSGPTASARLDSRSPRGMVSLYAAHAPGGSGAFARASDELNGSLWRQLNNSFALRAFAFGSKDDPGTGTTTSSTGASIGPSFRFNERTTFDLDLTASRNDFDGDSSGSASRELMATLGARTSLRAVNLRASVGGGNTTRSTTFADGSEFARSGGRFVLRGGADTYTSRGTFALDASLEKNDPSTGQVPSLAYVGVNASSVRVFTGPRAPTLNAAVWVNAYAGAPTNGPAIRVGTEIPLPSQFSLAIDAERNPYLRGNGLAPWVTVFRFERAINLPGLRHPSARGSVFDDRNGNGIRDGGEDGLGGVVVRHGSASMLTDANGRFRFYDQAPATTIPTVDMSSLAIGQMAPSRPAGGEVEVWELPVVRTSRLQVALTPTADSIGRLPTTTLTELAAIATDSTGAIWIAHADTAGVAVFDALPSGRYTITVDLSASTERLRQLQSAPVIHVTAGQELEVVRIPFGFRAIRVFDGGAGGAGGRRR